MILSCMLSYLQDLEEYIGLGEDFEVIKWGQTTKGWDHFMVEVDPSRHHVKISTWQL